MANTPGQGLPPIPADIAFITGPSILGICLNWGFMGVLVIQTFYYFTSFPHDSVKIKVLVYGLFLLDILQTIMVTADAFHWFVFGFGNMNQLDDTFFNSWDIPMLDALIGCIVQCFFSWRIYILRRSNVFPAIIVITALTQCACGIATASLAQEVGHLSLIRTGFTKIALQTTWLIGSAVADVLITIVLSWTLLSSPSRELPSCRGMIDRLVMLTVETNGATALTAVLALILFLGFPNHITFVVPPTAIIGKLYTNCLVAVFNNRAISDARSRSVNTSESKSGLSTFTTGTNLGSGGNSTLTTVHGVYPYPTKPNTKPAWRNVTLSRGGDTVNDYTYSPYDQEDNMELKDMSPPPTDRPGKGYHSNTWPSESMV